MTDYGRAVPDGLSSPTEPVSRLGPSGFDPSRGEGRHPYYGGCDGFGPLGMCSECTEVIQRDDGTFVDNRQGSPLLTQDEVAARVRTVLLREVECAALAAAMHTSKPKRLARFVRDVMADVLPRSLATEQPSGEQPF